REHMRKILIIVISSAICVAARAETTIDITRISERNFQLTLNNDRELSIADAQAQLRAAAANACGALIPEFRKYKFDSSALIEGKGISEQSTFKFVQQVACIESIPKSAPKQRRVFGEEVRAQISNLVKSATEEYFKALAAGRFKDAHEVFSDYMKRTLPFDEWRDDQRVLNAETGKLVRGGVWNVTVYVDPPSAPNLGLYVGTDYQYQSEGGAFRCGYLMWYSNSGRTYRVIRQEDGTLSIDEVKKLNEAQLREIKAKLRCGAP
ncbi:MAG: DUF4019 domain-containing protein, partial [Burkholderiaceae bacterium]